MQIASTFLITALALARIASARSCTTGLDYCGSNLFSIGNYNDIVGQALLDNGVNGDQDNVLFSCFGDWAPGTGMIQFIRDCGVGRCEDGGPGRSDFCAPN
ncbi:hypothetical protein BDZ94DRAFT_1298357 [Collybia nuda]|uniref:Uncharacterized protein n=1 Tax=Collybia nuda TaxID=64659 RepID=A0A9P6CJE1_9AGAR|nr:hypothetical protein BDZ94DRAFT_1298357 [Collybia nuda]